MSDDRTVWLTSREAFESSARMLHEKFPEVSTYKAQVQVLDENRQLRARVARLEQALELIAAPKRSDGTYNRSREACELLARAALDGEKGKGV
jgi:hypothetical protein